MNTSFVREYLLKLWNYSLIVYEFFKLESFTLTRNNKTRAPSEKAYKQQQYCVFVLLRFASGIVQKCSIMTHLDIA